jgi:phosphohistidine phosphatase
MPPLLYLVRHAHASDAADDAIRPISDRGEREIKQLAGILARSSAFRPSEIWHSPLVRARETAELVTTALQLKPVMRESASLLPEADPVAVVAALANVRVPVALCGHEPHLSALATLLVTGDTSPVAFAFQKATTLALELWSGNYRVLWQLSPDLFA